MRSGEVKPYVGILFGGGFCGRWESKILESRVAGEIGEGGRVIADRGGERADSYVIIIE